MAIARGVPLLTLLAGGLISCSARHPVVASLPPASAAPPGPAAAPSPPTWPYETPRADPALLQRKVLFGQADRSNVKISPDGKKIGWLGPVNGALNVWIAPADDVKKATVVTHSTSDAIRSWWWSFDSERVLYIDDKGGDDSARLYAIDLSKNASKDLTPIDGVHAELVGLSPKRPHEALVALNERDKKVRDVALVDLVTGVRKLAQLNDGGYTGWTSDDDLRVRFVQRRNADSSIDFLQPGSSKDPKQKWTPFQHVAVEDELMVQAIGFDKDGTSLYLKDSRNRDTSALFSIDVAADAKSGSATLLAEDPRADVGQILVSPATKIIEAVSFDYDRPTWKIVDASVEGDFYYLQTFGDGSLVVTSRSLDEQHWLVAYTHSDGPTHYYRYDRDADIPGNPGKATFLFTGEDRLEKAKLSPTVPVVIKARDGLNLVSYLTIPSASDPRSEGRPTAPIPTVVLVHDGPWARASLEYSADHQLFASRGYAVLSVNYRGSVGFGQKFVNAGNLQWGAKMNDDVVDAVRWAISEKIADPSKVAIVGTGYGGYAVLSAMEATPDTFACGIDFGGPSSLASYVTPDVQPLAARVGDPRTEEGKKLLLDRSPLSHLEALKNPVLIGQGKDDPRVPEVQTAAFVEALRAKRTPVVYAVYGNEEADLGDLTNRKSFAALEDVFLAECLGGSFQPIGNDLMGSTLTVPTGAKHIVGLPEALGLQK